MIRRTLTDILDIHVSQDGIERLEWRDFGNGLSMARLARAGKREIVLYKVAADATPDAFLKHEHIGGEFYLILKGRIVDDAGEFEKGDIVLLDPKSVHTPHAVGETLVLVVWPEGVRIVE